MSYRTSREHFDGLVEEAMRTIPRRFGRYFTNVNILVEDYPTEVDLEGLEADKYSLLGVFRGVSYPSKGGFFDQMPPLPDTIVLYQKNIEAICRSEKQLIEEIQKTLIHEVGHYFGMSEEDLRKYE